MKNPLDVVRDQIKNDIEHFDKQPVLMHTYKCDMHILDSKMKTGKNDNCTGCEGAIQCCKLSTVLSMYMAFQARMIKPKDFRASAELIIKDCKTQVEIISVMDSAIPTKGFL